MCGCVGGGAGARHRGREAGGGARDAERRNRWREVSGAKSAPGGACTSLEKVRPGIMPRFFSQKMAQKDPEKKMPST